MTVPKIQSSHNAETRNIINRAIDVINQQGRSIQDLVAEGQLTPTQYAQLISIVNGNVKKGDITADDIDKNNFQLNQTHLSDELLQQMAGNTPVNAVPADGSLTTEKYADNSVTYDKINFTDEVAKLAKNIIANGNFARDSNGDGVADGWHLLGGNLASPRVANNRQYWMPTSVAASSAPSNISGQDVFSGHKYYISVDQTNVGQIRFTGNWEFALRGIESNGKISLIYSPIESGEGLLRFYPRTANVEASIKNVMLVDLTETFGVGNEPTAEKFEYMISILGAGNWFDGTLNFLDASKNGVVTAGDLRFFDPENSINANNVNDALLELANGAVKAVPGKNLYNPEHNISGTLTQTNTSGVQGIEPSDTQVSQKIRITNDSDVTISNLVAYAITTSSDVVVSARHYVGGAVRIHTIKKESIPHDEYFLWVSARDHEVNSAQIEYSSTVTPYEPYKAVSAVYANGVKLFDYPLQVTGGGDKKKEIYDLAKAALEKLEMNEKISYLSNNAEISNKSSATNPFDTQSIPLKDSVNAQKMILHLHKREKEVGFGTINDAYLPNAKNDFSDVRITNDNGKVLPYRVIHRADDFDIVPYDWTRTSSMASATFIDSKGDLYQSDGSIRKSIDKGKAWTDLPAFSEMRNPSFNLIAKDDTMYFSYDNKLYRSEAPYTDYQMVKSLNPLNNDTFDKVHITGKSLVQHPDGEMFFGVYQTDWRIVIYKSTDNGFTWNLSADWEDKYQHVHGMFVDEYTGAIYAGLDGGGGVLKSTDKGETWIDLREQNPDMPQSTDYGVRYSDPSGYRLLGGETPIVGGHSIIKTFDDKNFTTVLNDGISVNYIIKLGNRMFATGSGSHGFRSGAIYVSRNDAETWEGVYRTGPILDLWSANDGYRYMEKMGDDEIFVGPQSFSRPPLRIFGSGHYAEIIVDIPTGTDSITVESGHSYPNELPITNDTVSSGSKLVHFELNENDRVIKELVSGDLFEGDFDWIKGGKRLSYFYPYINPTMDSNSATLKSLTGYDIDSSNFDVSTGVTISFWAKLSSGTRFTLFENDKGDRLEIVNGYQLHLNGANTISFNFPVIPEPFIKHDILIASDGSVSLYTNGLLRTMTSTEGVGILNALSGTENIRFLNGASSNPEDAIQHFMIRKGLISEDQALKEFNSGITDNIE